MKHIFTLGILCLTSSLAWGGSKRSSFYQQGEQFRRSLPWTQARRHKAQGLYAKGCKARHARSCWRWGRLLQSSQVASQVSLAGEAFHRACRYKLGDGCAAWGKHIAKDSPGNRKLQAKSKRLYRRACRLKSGVGCFQLLLWHEKKHKAIARPSRRRIRRYKKTRRRLVRKLKSYLTQGCRKGVETDCFYVGYAYYNGVLPKRLASAQKAFARSCQLHHANGCDFLALMYGNGLGGVRDFKKARALHNKACLLGLAEGCMHVGGMILRGLGGMKSPWQARQKLKRACQGNLAQGCLLLGEMVIRGEGGSRDVKGAYGIYHKACKLGSQQACKRYQSMKRILFTPSKRK